MKEEIFKMKFTRQPGPLADADLMPFGKHKNLAMQFVPLKYLHWFVDNCRYYTEGKEKGGENPWWENVRQYVNQRMSESVKAEKKPAPDVPALSQTSAPASDPVKAAAALAELRAFKASLGGAAPLTDSLIHTSPIA